MPTINPDLPSNGEDAVVDVYNAFLQAVLAVLNGGIDEDNLADNAVILSKLSSAVQGALVPTGAYFPYAGSAAPTGFLLCDGSSLLRSSYADLFAVIGTSFGAADGTHFNVPDLRGRVPVGLDNMGGTAANRIQKSSTITTSNGSPTATVASATDLTVGMYIESANVPDGTTITAISGTTLTMSANATAGGAGTAARFSLLGDAQEMGDAGGAQTHAITVPQLATHTHTFTTIYNVSDGATGGSQNVLRFNSAANQNFGIDNTGSNQPHTNVQPSILSNYIIKT